MVLDSRVDAPDGDAMGGSDGGGDAVAVDAGPADAGLPTGPFSTPTIIASLDGDGFSDDDPSFTGDLLELYFNSNRPGGSGSGDLWVATRARVTDGWGPPSPVTELNSASAETTPGVSRDGLTIWFGSQRGGGAGGQDIWVSARAARGDRWSAPSPVSELNTTSFDAAPAVDSTGLIMVLTSDRPGTGGVADLYATRRATTADPWMAAAGIAEINTGGEEGDASLSVAGRYLFFHSDRSGGAGGVDIFVATRPTTSEPFGTPIPVAELNTGADDSDAWVSEDLRYVVLTSNRGGGSRLYEASR